MSEKITFKIDGHSIQAEKGMTILVAAQANDIYIPNLCHHPDLVPVGACRMCGVEVDGGKMVMSCMTEAREGIDVKTYSPDIYTARKVTMDLLIADHHMDCLACEAADDCGLLTVTSYLGIQPELEGGLRPMG